MPWIICYLHVPTQLLPLKKAQRMSFPMRRNAVGSDTMENLWYGETQGDGAWGWLSFAKSFNHYVKSKESTERHVFWLKAQPMETTPNPKQHINSVDDSPDHDDDRAYDDDGLHCVIITCPFFFPFLSFSFSFPFPFPWSVTGGPHVPNKTPRRVWLPHYIILKL